MLHVQKEGPTPFHAMTPCDELHTGVMRDFMRDLHRVAAYADEHIVAHREHHCATLSRTDPQAMRALQAHTARELQDFAAAVATLADEHRNRLLR